MRAAVMRDRKLLVDDIPAPVPGPGQVLVRTLACGICGSDLHALRFGERMLELSKRTEQIFRMDLARDVVMGHEFCAEILDFGPDTQRRLRPGTRVCSVPITFGAGGLQSVGYSNEAPGGYGEQMVLSELLLREVPQDVPTEHAALTEPMAVALHAVEKAGLAPEDVPLVIGCGPVGLAVIAVLRLRGADPIVAADFSPGRRELAAQLGANRVVDPAAESPYTSWRELARKDAPPNPLAALGLGPGARPGVIFECVGVPGVLEQVMQGAMRGTRIVVVGVCMERDTLEPIFGINKELAIQFVLGYTPDEFTRTLRHIADGDLPVAPLITGRVGVDGIPGAFEALGTPEAHAKILAEPWR